MVGTPTALKMGDSVGGYMLTSHLGGGPAAHAYRAQDQRGRVVALRVLRPEIAASPDWVDHFLTASAALAQIEHPSLGKVLETGVDQGVPFVAEEYLGAQHLIFIIFNDGIRQDQAVRLLTALADLAAFLQAVKPPVRISGIRPTDVFYAEDGTTKVCHCGVLKSPHIEAAPGPARTSVPPSQCLAPEVMAGSPPDDRSDVYSIGQILLRTLRGNWGSAAILRDLRKGLDIRKVIEDLESVAVDGILRSCLQQRPEDRIQNAATLLEAALKLQKAPIAPTLAPIGLTLSPAPKPVPATAPRALGSAAPQPEIDVPEPAATPQTEAATATPAPAPAPEAAEAPSPEPTPTEAPVGGAPEQPMPPIPAEPVPVSAKSAAFEMEAEPVSADAPHLDAFDDGAGDARAIVRRPMVIRMGAELAPTAPRASASKGDGLSPIDSAFYLRYPAPRIREAKRRRRLPGAFAKAPT